MEIVKSQHNDIPAILSLYRDAMGDHKTVAEKAQQGFIQGHFDAAFLMQCQASIGIYIVRENHHVIAAANVIRGNMLMSGPAAQTYQIACAANPDIPPERIFLYGPVTVSTHFRGQGLLSTLLTFMCKDLQDEFQLGAAFVDSRNEKSLAIHRHYSLSEAGHFCFNAHDYVVLTFSPRVLSQSLAT